MTKKFPRRPSDNSAYLPPSAQADPRDQQETTVLPPVLSTESTPGPTRLRQWRTLPRPFLTFGGILTGTALALGILAGILLFLTAGLRSEVDTLRTQLSTEQQAVVDTQKEVDQLRADLATSRQRVLDLAGNAGLAANAQQLIDDLTALADAGGAVTQALERCINEQDDLIAILHDASSYNATELASYEASVNEVCQAAIAAGDAYIEQLR